MQEGILFEQVEDSRQDWKVKHSVSEILTVVMCGVSAGERSIYGIREFAWLKEQWLRDVIGLKLPNGLPSYDTVRRVLGILDTKQFQSVFIRWYRARTRDSRGQLCQFRWENAQRKRAESSRHRSITSITRL